MNRRNRILIVIAVVATLGGLACYFGKTKEPRSQGRSLTQWLQVYCKTFPTQWIPPELGKPDMSFQTAERVVKGMGTNAIPTLLKLSQAEDSPAKLKLLAYLRRQSVIRYNYLYAEERRDLAANGFGMLKEDALPAVPALVELTKSKGQEIRLHALRCLIIINPSRDQLLPVLLRACRESDSKMRHVATANLQALYPEEAEKAHVHDPLQLRPFVTNAPESTKESLK
ncbi:HEAT repeat domain-containing protein [Pedosphaera parvula]|uniref:HEAT repeat domain-containing protein n=1 Tax=Pedosphaera parvula (strain Ellin514) TaxID=320771 RepID=B9X9X3_PEDPL|nr:HEAT repeat domain-containing protein [Pedosphaera parvula]EEF63314.1 hypothetical protein Cflav_PD5949 [Pedosphaera parvula Ellin514]